MPINDLNLLLTMPQPCTCIGSAASQRICSPRRPLHAPVIVAAWPEKSLGEVEKEVCNYRAEI